LAVVAAIVFVGVAVHEFSYANDHPYAYGPAEVIAWGAGAGALACMAIALVGYGLTRSDRP
jgi:hypothetical protein